MLVISRKAHEFVQIGENIVVKVIKTANGSVKIGIDAPGGMRVLRGELSDESSARNNPLGEVRRPALTLRGDREVAETLSVL